MPDERGLRSGSATSAPGAHRRRLRALAARAAPPGFYLLAATAFVTFYTQRTVWLPPGPQGWTDGQAPFPFRYRALPLWVAGLLAKGVGRARLPWIYFAIATVATCAGLLAYRAFLARFVRGRLATLLAFGLLYVMAWHYAVLNALYFPFDLPAVLFFTAGWLFCLRRSWRAYYPVFLLGCFNRETILFLAVLFALTWFGRMPRRRLALHLGAQAILYLGVKALLVRMYPAPDAALYASVWWKNRETYLGLLTLRGNGLKDWAKLVLAFGGFWWLLPFVWRAQPPEIRRSLLLVPIFVLTLQRVATIDEMRIYAELLPVVATPVLLALARWVDGERCAPARPGEPGGEGSAEPARPAAAGSVYGPPDRP